MIVSLMVPGTDRVLADLKMYTDLSTHHYLRGMIVLKNEFLKLNEETNT